MLMPKSLLLLGSLLVSSQLAVAKPCGLKSEAGSNCDVAISELKPTQLTFGAIEVQRRSEKFADMSEKKLQKYLSKNLVPVVIGPKGDVYITDHHHLALAIAALKGDDFELSAEVVQNWASYSSDRFWSAMSAADYTWLYNEEGEGPLSYKTLPNSLFVLKDDPYRALAWGVRKAGAYDETSVPHADFMWANFFRSRMEKAEIQEDFDQAVTSAVALAHSKEAKHLPGYQN